MGTKIIIGAAIFIGSFGIGLGTTYLVISKVGSEAPIAAPPSMTDAESEWPATAAVRTDVTELALTPTSNHRTAEAVPGGDDVQQPDSGAVPSPGPVADDNTPVVIAEAKWWNSVVGNRCRIGLEEVGFSSLSLREGIVKPGEVTTFESSFGANRRLAVFKAIEKPVVEVLALGFDDNGLPSVAQVLDPRSGATGVISLQVEAKQIRLLPINGEQ